MRYEKLFRRTHISQLNLLHGTKKQESRILKTKLIPHENSIFEGVMYGGSVAEWLACWTQAQKGPGSNRSRDAVG